MPHLITQRGEQGRQVFFSADDCREYLRLMTDTCARWDVKVLAYCLMPNHVHMVVIPAKTNALARSMGEAHRRYAVYINERYGQQGRLWHARFASFAAQAELAAPLARYVERDPVDCGMVERPDGFTWSSASVRAQGGKEPLLTDPPETPNGESWADYIAQPNDKEQAIRIGKHERTGRPMGELEFILKLEKKIAKRLRPRKRGRKPKGSKPGDDD